MSESNVIPTWQRPIIIIGAGRSGTNMLRDLLVAHSQFATWPCDEINYIWRHGNRAFPTDQFTRAMADERTKRYIRKQFRSFANSAPGCQVIEKTCANSLRCGFVHEVFPEAKFIHIMRDGRDVAASAALRWNAKLDVPYLLKKARYVPWSDLPYYGGRYLMARLYRLFSGKKRLSTWGPKFAGMEDAFRNAELPVGCAIQWKACVEAARDQLAEVPQAQVLNLTYEAFTADPIAELSKTFAFLNVDVDPETLAQLAPNVSAKSVGKWRKQLTESQAAEVHEVVGGLLDELGYISKETPADATT